MRSGLNVAEKEKDKRRKIKCGISDCYVKSQRIQINTNIK